LTIYVELPLSAYKDADCPLWSCSFEELINEVIDGYSSAEPPAIVGDEFVAIIERMAARLRELAQKLDDCVTRGKAKTQELQPKDDDDE
jgi:hypothetical protein